MREEQRPPIEGIDEVAPGILRLQLPISFPGLGHVNCYILEDRRGVALVDPGLPGLKTWRFLKKQLQTIGIPIARVHTVVVTHSHPDHFGQAGRLRKASGAEVITHKSFRTFLDPEAEADDEELITSFDSEHQDADPNTGTPDAAGAGSESGSEAASCGHHHTANGQTAHSHASNGTAATPRMADSPFVEVTPWGGKPYELPLSRRIRYKAMRYGAGKFFSTPKPTRRVADADVLELGGREWVSVHTPGHTQDHLCLWDADKGVMITGDHVLPTITPHISGLTDSADPLAQFFDSLELMKTFDNVNTVLPAHGLTFEDLPGRAEAIAQHHHDRLDELRAASDVVGAGTVEEYMKQLFKPRSWGPMAESETYAHLQHMKLRNQAETNSDGSQLRFTIRD
jgi:glyoxylase-like metal-dependent hydrolase (beta-lactamase superfamily II)